MSATEAELSKSFSTWYDTVHAERPIDTADTFQGVRRYLAVCELREELTSVLNAGETVRPPP